MYYEDPNFTPATMLDLASQFDAGAGGMQVGVHAIWPALTRMHVQDNEQMSDSTRLRCGGSGGVSATATDR